MLNRFIKMIKSTKRLFIEVFRSAGEPFVDDNNDEKEEK